MEKIKFSEPGTLNPTLPVGWKIATCGVGMYPTVAIDPDENTWIAEVHAIDGYEVADAGYEYPEGTRRTVYESAEFKAQFNVPEGFEFLLSGMNDTAEGGYILYTNGMWVKHPISIDAPEGEDPGAFPEGYENGRLDESHPYYNWWWTVQSDQ